MAGIEEMKAASRWGRLCVALSRRLGNRVVFGYQATTIEVRWHG